LGHVEFVHTRHGAGDRAGSLARELAGLDLILTAESKVREWLIRMGLGESAQCFDIGYPKFEGKRPLSGQRNLFNSGKLTVLYNPHCERGVSSWSPMGKAVLNFFKHYID
jgi:hypothetical protein